MSFHNHDEPSEIRKRFPGMTFGKFSQEISECVTPTPNNSHMNELYIIYKSLQSPGSARDFAKWHFSEGHDIFSIIDSSS